MRTHAHHVKFYFLLLACLVVGSRDFARAENGGLPWANGPKSAEVKPREIENVGIYEQLGQKIDTSLTFRDENGASVSLSQFFRPGHPVILSPVYYSCPNLCNLHLNGLLDALKTLDWTTGSKFEVIAISIDPKETPDLAKAKKENYMKAYGRPEGARGFHFLTGDEASIHAITEQVGFKYKWDAASSQWSHSAAAIVLTPEAKISRYLYGILFDGKTIRLSLVEASSGHIAEIIDRMVLFCFQYDPHRKGYAFYAWNLMRVGAGITVIGLAAFLISFVNRQRKRSV